MVFPHSTVRELEDRIKIFESPEEKISFLQKFISHHPRTEHEILASAYSLLAIAMQSIGNENPDIFLKAANQWVYVGTIQDYAGQQNSSRIKRLAFIEAVSNYRKAARLYAKNGETSRYNEIKKDISEVRHQLRQLQHPFRYVGLILVFGFFLFAFLFLGAPPTGYSVIELESGETTIAGMIFAILAVIGAFFVYRFWR